MAFVPKSAPDPRYQRLQDPSSHSTPFGLHDVDRLLKRLDLLFLDVDVDLATNQISQKGVLEILHLAQLRIATLSDKLGDSAGPDALRFKIS